MAFYLATRPNRHVFYADRPAAVGQTLRRVAPPAPFSQKGIWVAASPAAALAIPWATWPCALWEVSGEPEGGSRPDDLDRHLHVVAELTVTAALDPSLSLGPQAASVIAFFAELGELRASDMRVAQTLEDEWLGASGEDADSSKAPTNQALTLLLDLVRRHDLAAAREAATKHGRELGQRVIDQLSDDEYMERMPPGQNPLRNIEVHLRTAVYLAVSALVVADHLDPEQFELMVGDWSRLTGRTVPQPGPCSGQAGAGGTDAGDKSGGASSTRSSTAPVRLDCPRGP